jgi:hypothetical protein
MKRHLLPAAVGCAALMLGILVGSIHQRLVQKRLAAQVARSTPSAPPQPAEPTASVATKDEVYPEDDGLTPFDIEWFIDRHPGGDLTRLWERLKVKNESGSFGWGCVNCKAQSFYHNLDDDADDEVVLRIADRMTESFRYLIFKQRGHKDTSLLGHIDAWAKYKPSTHSVLLSGGKAWLVVESQAASGSGLAAYYHTIYQVSARSVKPVAAYFSEIAQHDWEFPSRDVVGRPVSVEIQNGIVKATVSYTVDYSTRIDGKEVPLFVKRQTAVLIDDRLDTTLSNITRHEFETVYNFDSLFEDAFLKYNRSELREIAVGRNESKKEWLKQFLETCENSSIKRELSSLLR